MKNLLRTFCGKIHIISVVQSICELFRWSHLIICTKKVPLRSLCSCYFPIAVTLAFRAQILPDIFRHRFKFILRLGFLVIIIVNFDTVPTVRL